MDHCALDCYLILCVLRSRFNQKYACVKPNFLMPIEIYIVVIIKNVVLIDTIAKRRSISWYRSESYFERNGLLFLLCSKLFMQQHFEWLSKFFSKKGGSSNNTKSPEKGFRNTVLLPGKIFFIYAPKKIIRAIYSHTSNGIGYIIKMTSKRL